MKKLFFEIIFAAATVFGHPAFALTAVVPQGMPSTVERPETRVGDSWSYQLRDGFTGLVQSEHTRVVTQVANNQNVILVKNVSGAEAKMTETSEMNTISQGTTRFTTKTGQFVFPLIIGETWVAENDSDTKNYRNSYDFNVTVVGWEEVKIVGGTFLALKITLKGHLNSNLRTGLYLGAESIDIVRWYAPVVRRVVKEDIKVRGSDDRGVSNWLISELTKYQLATD